MCTTVYRSAASCPQQSHVHGSLRFNSLVPTAIFGSAASCPPQPYVQRLPSLSDSHERTLVYRTAAPQRRPANRSGFAVLDLEQAANRDTHRSSRTPHTDTHAPFKYRDEARRNHTPTTSEVPGMQRSSCQRLASPQKSRSFSALSEVTVAVDRKIGDATNLVHIVSTFDIITNVEVTKIVLHLSSVNGWTKTCQLLEAEFSGDRKLLHL